VQPLAQTVNVAALAPELGKKTHKTHQSKDP
jgi:hypothetical protein